MSEITELSPEHVDQALDTNTDDMLESAIGISGLSTAHKVIIRIELENFMSDSPRMSAQQIADEADCHIATVNRAHKSTEYQRLHDQLCDQLFQNKAHIFYTSLVHAADKGKVGAIKLGLEVTGKHTPRLETRSLNLNATMSIDTSISPDAMLEKMLTMIGNKGISLEKVVDTWQALKKQQAF